MNIPSLPKETLLNRALGILNEAKSLEVITGDFSTLSDEKKIKLAETLVEKARKAYAKNERGEHITRILFAADVDISPQQSQDSDEELYQSLINEHIEKGLSEPPEIEGDAPELPLDLTELSDKQVRWLHGAFNACSARVGWLYAIEEAGAAAAKQIADHLEEEYIVNDADRKDYGGKPKPQALLKSEAKAANLDIEKWRKREHKHSISAGKLKRLFEIYNNNCERLSREWTMRIQERDSS